MITIKSDSLMQKVAIIAQSGRLTVRVLPLGQTEAEPTIHGSQIRIYISWMPTDRMKKDLQTDMGMKFI